MTVGGDQGPQPSAGALDFRPDLAEFAALAKAHTIVPVSCEVVADTLTPVTCFANVVGEGDGFLFESVEGGERWGRYSFVGRRPLATLTARGRRVEAAGRLGLQSSDDGILAAVETLVARFNRRRWTGSRPCTGDWSGISATTWCARSSVSRTCRRTTWAIPTPRCRHRPVLRLRRTGASASS